MKTKILYLILLLLLFSCNKNKQTSLSQAKINDSVFYYFKKIKNDTTGKLKIFDMNKLFYLLKTKNSYSNRFNLSNLAIEYYKINNLLKLKEVSYKLYNFSSEAKDSLNLANANRFLGGYYKFSGEIDSSFYFYTKAEKIYKLKKDDLNLANILFNKGIIQCIIGDYLGSELSLKKAYLIYNNTTEYDKLYGTLNQLGLVYNELKEYKDSEIYHEKALYTVKAHNLQSSENQESVCYNNLGYLFLKQKSYNRAILNFQLGLVNKNLKKENPNLYANLIDNLAYCKLKLGFYNGLSSLFNDALETRKNLGDLTFIVGSYIHLSEYYSNIKDFEKAILFSNKAIELARKSKIPVNIVLALKQASLVDKVNSSKYSETYIRISDSLQFSERKNIDRFARIELETDELKKENVFLEQKNRDFFNYFMGAIAIAGFLFFMRAQRARRREAILKQAQQQANEEIYKLIITQQSKLDEGRVMEKTRIAKELHDGVLGRIFGLRLNLDGLNHRTDNEVPNERIKCLDELKVIEQDLREISHELSREKYVLINNFVSIVNQLFDDQRKINVAVLNTSISEAIDWDTILGTTKINLYRVLQECFQNINKYAEAKIITVLFRKDKKGNLTLSITDDGVGFDMEKNRGGIGINNIITRVSECQGTTEIASEKDKGTRYSIVVPMEHKIIKI